MNKAVKKYTVTIDYEIEVTPEHKPTLKEERQTLTKEAFGDAEAFAGSNIEVTRVHVTARKGGE